MAHRCTSTPSSSFAVQWGHADVCRLLLERGAPVDARTKANWTPLHNACREGHLNVVAVLLDFQADLAATTNFKSTPLHLAAKGHHFSIVQLLVRRGADVSAREADYEGPLKHAESNEMVDFLLNEGAW